MHSNEDRALGRFYTPPTLVALVLGLARGTDCDNTPQRLWDPTCGDGAFLRGARDAGVPEDRLHGSDLDGHAIAGLREAMPAASLTHSDLFALTPRQLGTFDVIVGNPPFLRTERVAAADRARVRAQVQAQVGVPIPGSADISLLALVWCCRFLRPGGTLAFVLPCTVLDVSSGETLRSWLSENYRVRFVLDSVVEPWFVDAAVNTVVVVVQATRPGPVTFCRLAVPVSGALAGPLRAEKSHPGVSQRTLPGAALSAPRWSLLLRAPDLWFSLRERAGAGLVPTAARVTLSYGVKPGISDFFAPRPPPDVESSCLRPFLRTLRGQHRYRVTEADTPDRLFVVPPAIDPPPRARLWIEQGAARTSRGGVPYPEVPSVRGNAPWWRLSAPDIGPVLIPQFRASRHHILHNPERVAVNNSAWHGSFVDPAHEELGVALLNSTVMALGAEVLGRTNLGQGLLTLYGPELAAVPMPDPARFDGAVADTVRAAWARLVSRPVLPLEDELDQPDRQALDRAVCVGLGLDPTLAPTLGAAALTLMHTRLGLASKRRAQSSAR